MAFELLGHLRDLTYSRLEQPFTAGVVINNLIKFSIWGALGTGGVATVASLFSRVVIERNTLTPPIFKASLISCGTFTVFATLLIYSTTEIYSPTEGEKVPLTKKLNADAIFLESRFGLTLAIGGIAAILARPLLKIPPFKTITDHPAYALFWITTTITAIHLFHDYQNRQLTRPPDGK